MDNIRIKDIAVIATSINSDDYFVLDGNTANVRRMLLEKFALLESPIFTGKITTPSIILSGAISSNAWLTNGIIFKSIPTTLTDTSSIGTVAASYTNVFGGDTIAASNVIVFNDYFSTYIKEPIIGNNVTFIKKWALGLGGNLSVSGGISAGGNVIITGDIGLGTVAPKAPLDFGTHSTGGRPFWLMYNNDTGINMGVWRDTPAANNTAFITNHSGSFVFGNSADTPTPTFGTEWVRITNNGYCGFGTASPQARSHIKEDGGGTIVSIVQTAASQTASASEWWDSNNIPVAKMKANGVMNVVGFATSYALKTASYTITDNDSIIGCNGTFTVTFLSAVGLTSRGFTIKNLGVGVITIVASGAETIDGATTYVLSTQYNSVTLVSNNINWMIV